MCVRFVCLSTTIITKSKSILSYQQNNNNNSINILCNFYEFALSLCCLSLAYLPDTLSISLCCSSLCAPALKVVNIEWESEWVSTKCIWVTLCVCKMYVRITHVAMGKRKLVPFFNSLFKLNNNNNKQCAQLNLILGINKFSCCPACTTRLAAVLTRNQQEQLARTHSLTRAHTHASNSCCVFSVLSPLTIFHSSYFTAPSQPQ